MRLRERLATQEYSIYFYEPRFIWEDQFKVHLYKKVKCEYIGCDPSYKDELILTVVSEDEKYCQEMFKLYRDLILKNQKL